MKAKVIEFEVPGVKRKQRMVIVPGPVTEPESRGRAGRPSRSRRTRSARTSRAATESGEAPASPDGDSPAPSPRPASRRRPGLVPAPPPEHRPFLDTLAELLAESVLRDLQRDTMLAPESTYQP